MKSQKLFFILAFIFSLSFTAVFADTNTSLVRILLSTITKPLNGELMPINHLVEDININEDRERYSFDIKGISQPNTENRVYVTTPVPALIENFDADIDATNRQVTFTWEPRDIFQQPYKVVERNETWALPEDPADFGFDAECRAPMTEELQECEEIEYFWEPYVGTDQNECVGEDANKCFLINCSEDNTNCNYLKCEGEIKKTKSIECTATFTCSTWWEGVFDNEKFTKSSAPDRFKKIDYDYNDLTNKIPIGPATKIRTSNKKGLFKYSFHWEQKAEVDQNLHYTPISTSSYGGIKNLLASNSNIMRDGAQLVAINLSDPYYEESLPESCASKLDVIFIIDSSGSIAKSDWGRAMTFIITLIDTAFDVGPDLVKIGAIQFSTNIQKIISLSSDATAIKNAISSASHMKGMTNTIDAFIEAEAMMDIDSRNDSHHLIILITDGNPNRGTPKNPVGVSDRMKDKGMKIIGISIGRSIDKRMIKSWVSDPIDNHFFDSSDWAALGPKLNVISAAVCQHSTPINIISSSLEGQPCGIPTTCPLSCTADLLNEHEIKDFDILVDDYEKYELWYNIEGDSELPYMQYIGVQRNLDISRQIEIPESVIPNYEIAGREANVNEGSMRNPKAGTTIINFADIKGKDEYGNDISLVTNPNLKVHFALFEVQRVDIADTKKGDPPLSDNRVADPDAFKDGPSEPNNDRIDLDVVEDPTNPLESTNDEGYLITAKNEVKIENNIASQESDYNPSVKIEYELKDKKVIADPDGNFEIYNFSLLSLNPLQNTYHSIYATYPSSDTRFGKDGKTFYMSSQRGTSNIITAPTTLTGEHFFATQSVPFGTVYNAWTKEPVPKATVKGVGRMYASMDQIGDLIEVETLQKANYDGYFDLAANPGFYKIYVTEVLKDEITATESPVPGTSNFVYPSRIIAMNAPYGAGIDCSLLPLSSDLYYENVYCQDPPKQIEIEKKLVNINIPVDPTIYGTTNIIYADQKIILTNSLGEELHSSIIMPDGRFSFFKKFESGEVYKLILEDGTEVGVLANSSPINF